MRKLLKIAIAFIPAILVVIMTLNKPFYSIDAWFCDVIYSQMNGLGNDIVLVCVDEETLKEYGTFSSWSREKSAQLIDTLYADKDMEPAVLAFDIMFIGDSDAKNDLALTKAAEGKDRLVLASNMVFRGKLNYSEDGAPVYDVNNIEMEELPFDSLNEVADTGYANVSLSKDGFVRTTQVYTDKDNKRRYSFASQIYRAYMEYLGEGENAVNNLDKNQIVQFFYSGKPGECTKYSMCSVLDGSVPPQAFKGKIVLVGAYAPGLQDSYHSAAKRGQEMYGVEINANIVRALQTGKTAIPVNTLYVAIISFIVIFIYTLVSREMEMYPALIVGVWILMADLIICRIFATKGYLINVSYLLITCLLIMVWLIIEKYVWETVKRKRVLNSFKKYMAPQVIESLSKDGDFNIELGGEERNVAVLFVDIRGFTSMSETLNPKEVVQILNQYLTLTTECIHEHGGMLDKFIGDATMAIFNAPNNQEDYVYQAVLAGLAMKERGTQLGEKLLAEHGKTVSFGVGVHVGNAVVGNIGCENRMDYTAIGDTVNTASRIEGKAGRGELLISEDVYKILEGRIVADYKEAMELKGKKEPVNVYSVTGIVK